MKKPFSLPFYWAFVLVYLVLDIVGLAIYFAMGTYLLPDVTVDNIVVFFAYLFAIICQMIFGLGIWLIYKFVKNKWMVLWTSLILLGFTILISVGVEGNFAIFILFIPILGAGTPYIEILFEENNLLIFELLMPSVIYTVVTFLALVLSKNRWKMHSVAIDTDLKR